MIAGFVTLVVLVAIVMSVFHVSAGWAWIIVLGGIAAFVVYTVSQRPGIESSANLDDDGSELIDDEGRTI